MTETTRHDAVLATLPVPLVAALAWSWLANVTLAVALGAGALAAVAPLVYGLFVKPPTAA